MSYTLTYQNFIKFSLIQNSKNPSKEWMKCNRKKYFRKGIIKGNSGIPTGKEYNNIIVVDLDFYKDDFYNDDDNLFIKTFKNFVELFNTYTVKSPNNGYHLYFEYDEDIKQTSNEKLKIDIRSDGGYIVAPYSKIDNKTYDIINDVKIKKIPKNLKDFLLNNLYTIEQKIKNEKKYKLNKTVIKNNFKYNITKDELKEIIYKLPDKYWSNNDEFLKFTTFCKIFDIQDLWDEINKTKPKYNYENNINKYWNTCKTEYNLIIDEILYSMNGKKDKNNKSIEGQLIINYCKYKPILKNVIKPDKEINKKKLGYDFFNNEKDYIIKSDTGTGKTTSFKHYIKKINKPFISIVSRVSLGQEQYNTFSKFNIDCKFYKYENEFIQNDNIIIQVDSIRKLYNIDFSNYIIFLDEYNSIIEYLICSDTLHKTRYLIYNKFLRILKKCNQIISVDADINDISFEYFKNLNRTNYIFIKNNYLHNSGVKAEEIKTISLMLKKVKEYNEYLICVDSANSAELIKKELNDNDVIVIIGGDDQYYNLDEHKKIIFSPKIIYGIDSTMKRPVFVYYKEHTIDPTHYLQQIARCRNITHLYYTFLKKKFINIDYTLNDVKDEIYKQNLLGLRYFEDEANKNIYNQYEKLLCKYIYNHKCYISNKFSHFNLLLDKRGFIRLNKNNKSKKYLKCDSKLRNELKQYKIDNFDINNYTKLNEILKIPIDDVDYYKEYFIDKFKLQKHFNIMRFINKNKGDLENEIENIKEMAVKKITSTKAQMVYLYKLKKYCNNDDFKDITINKKIDNGTLKILKEEYDIIFRNRDKSKWTNNKIVQKFLIKIYRGLFGNDIIKSESIKEYNENKKRITTQKYYINDDSYNEHLNLYEYRKNNNNNVDLFLNEENE